MTNEAFTILRAAVTLAKNQQIQTTAALRDALVKHYPGQETHIDSALQAWANHAHGS